MVSSSTHIRLTRTSSDLQKLSAILLPPSPILNADDLLNSSTSGEIPILLDAITHACDSPLSISGEPPGLRSADKLDTTVGNVARDLTHRDEAPFEDWMCGESDLDNVLAPPGLPNERHGEPSSDRAASMENMIHQDVVGRKARRLSIPGDRSTPMVRRDKREESLDPQVPCPCTMEFSTAMVLKEDLDGDQPLTIATFHTYSTLPTPAFAPPSPSSSAGVVSPSSSPVGRQRHRRPLERARAVRFPGRPRSPRLHVNEVEPNLVRNTPTSPTKLVPSPRWQLTDTALPVPVHLCTADTRFCNTVPPSLKLPKEFSRMKHMAIELWIDQEGFRAVRSCMQLVGYSPRTRSLHPYESAEDDGSGVAAGVAEFMPTKRETFAFHYATLDGPPTLRMVSVAGDESRDYISRQATLSVKANGVYTVIGTETFVASMQNNDAYGSRLRWKFDYLVSDRKADGTGKTLPGEKTLTPLTFSCSPYLFHLLQGKKAGLMHIMKKNLVPKLGSQKLEPPTYAMGPSVLPQVSRHLTTGRDAVTHARSHSDASPKTRHHTLTRSPPDTEYGGSKLGMNHIPRARRRRASSAGENSLSFQKSNLDMVGSRR